MAKTNDTSKKQIRPGGKSKGDPDTGSTGGIYIPSSTIMPLLKISKMFLKGSISLAASPRNKDAMRILKKLSHELDRQGLKFEIKNEFKLVHGKDEFIKKG